MKWRNKKVAQLCWEQSLKSGYKQTAKRFAWLPTPIDDGNWVWLESFYTHHTWYKGPNHGWWTSITSLSKEHK